MQTNEAIPPELGFTPEVRRQLVTRLRTHLDAGLDLTKLSLDEWTALDRLLGHEAVRVAVLRDLGL